MKLKQILRDQAYDLVEGPERGFAPLQLWRKKSFQKIEPYEGNIQEIFGIDNQLTEHPARVTNINFSNHQDFEFKHGVSVLKTLLEKLNLGDLGGELSGKIDRKITASYSGCQSRKVYPRDLIQYFEKADLTSAGNSFLDDANKDNFIVITGVMEATDIQWVLESTIDLKSELKTTIKKMVDLNLKHDFLNEKKLELTFEGVEPLVFAVKASRLVCKKDQFHELKPVSDNRRWF
jgi:hypothetical protein